MKTDDLIQKEVAKARKVFDKKLCYCRCHRKPNPKGNIGHCLRCSERIREQREMYLITSSLHKIKDEAKREAIEKVDDYFEGLVVMPFPQESRKVLINSLKEDGGEYEK